MGATMHLAPRGGAPVGRFSGCSNVRAPPGQRSLTLPGDAAFPGRPRSPRPPCAGRLPRGTIPPTNTASRFGTPPAVPGVRGEPAGMRSPASCTSESWVGRKPSQHLTPRGAAACNAAESLLTRFALLPTTPEWRWRGGLPDTRQPKKSTTTPRRVPRPEACTQRPPRWQLRPPVRRILPQPVIPEAVSP